MKKIIKMSVYIVFATAFLYSFAADEHQRQDIKGLDFYLKQGGVGSDFGSKFGLLTLAFLWEKGAVIAGGLKTTAVVAGSASATPYIIGVVTVGGAYYAIYRGYCYYYPTEEEIANMEKSAIKRQLKIKQTQEKLNLIHARANFIECINSNADGPQKKCVPVSCLKHAANLAMRAPDQNEVEKIVSGLNWHKECSKN